MSTEVEGLDRDADVAAVADAALVVEADAGQPAPALWAHGLRVDVGDGRLAYVLVGVGGVEHDELVVARVDDGAAVEGGGHVGHQDVHLPPPVLRDGRVVVADPRAPLRGQRAVGELDRGDLEGRGNCPSKIRTANSRANDRSEKRDLGLEIDVAADVPHPDAGDDVPRRRLEAVRVERPLLVAHLHVVLVLHRPLDAHLRGWLPLPSLFSYPTLNES